MSLIPSMFGGRRSNVFDPFSLEVWDPFQDFPSFAVSGPRTEFSNDEAAQFANTRIDWKETPKEHVFKVDLPGKEKEEKNDKWRRVERSSGRFLRRFRLPENARVDQVKAAMEDGVLTVTVPKEEVKKPDVKCIEISG
ncbi:hypothetical protein Syun_000418 [Stephania yunnanensis]|uniref:SHSP domain-containing protein n=1 Tax=Stephania yunnanensis TaxID=152371 RepID=A0AAP0Q627_9MAGN